MASSRRATVAVDSPSLSGASSTFKKYASAHLSDSRCSEGRGAAAEVDAWLMGGNTRLPRAGGIKSRVRKTFLMLKV